MSVTYPTPTPKQLKTAFVDHGVRFVEHPKCNVGRNAWTSGLRAATVHHTAGKNSADYLASFNWGGANCVVNNGTYNGTKNDGRAVILCWGSAWHSGKGGPWKGVAGKDSLHLVSWGMELESLGTKRDITDAMKETTGRMLAALVDLGMPQEHIHRHEDWTDGSGPVGGYPLATNGRKIDTRDDLGYTTTLWVDLSERYLERGKWWDGIVPDIAGIFNAMDDRALRNPAAWRLACRLADLDHARAPQPKYMQGYPVRAVSSFARATGWNGQPEGAYSPALHEAIFA